MVDHDRDHPGDQTCILRKNLKQSHKIHIKMQQRSVKASQGSSGKRRMGHGEVRSGG